MRGSDRDSRSTTCIWTGFTILFVPAQVPFISALRPWFHCDPFAFQDASADVFDAQDFVGVIEFLDVREAFDVQGALAPQRCHGTHSVPARRTPGGHLARKTCSSQLKRAMELIKSISDLFLILFPESRQAHEKPAWRALCAGTSQSVGGARFRV